MRLTRALAQTTCLMLALETPVGAQEANAQPSAVVTAIASVTTSQGQIRWQPTRDFDRMVLSVADPRGVVHRFEFPAGESPTLDLGSPNGGPAPDGHYTWELRAVPPGASALRGELSEAIADGSAARAGRIRALLDPPPQVGHFAVVGGRLMAPEHSRAEGVAPMDQVVPDDLVVDGKACVGLGCGVNENFGPEALRLKQSVVRLQFRDTSTQPGYPSSDWQLTANDGPSGGAEKFSLDDLTSGTTPLTIQGGAPSDSLHVAATTGDVGLGTATPEKQLHIKDASAPTIRLEDTNASAVWDLVANGASLEVQTGSSTPLKIGTTTVTAILDGGESSGSGRPVDGAIVQVLRHATDCTALTVGRSGELCYEKDSDKLFVCKPTADDCITPAEWQELGPSDPTLAGDVGGPASANELDEFAVETRLESVLDLPDLQGQLALGTQTTGTLGAGNGGTGITSLGAGIATFLETPSSANLNSAVADGTGSGALVFATSPTLVTAAVSTSLETPSVYGGAGAGDDLTLQSTSNATKGDVTIGQGLNSRIRLDEAGDRMVIGGGATVASQGIRFAPVLNNDSPNTRGVAFTPVIESNMTGIAGISLAPFLRPGANLGNSFGVIAVPNIQRAADDSASYNITDLWAYYNRIDLNANYGGTITNAINFQINNSTIGGAGAITNLIGLRIADLTQGGTTNRAIWSSVSPGSGKHNLYLDGAAPNYFAGNVGIKEATPAAELEISSASTSTLQILSSGAGLGGRIILEDTDGAGCTQITALNGVLAATIVPCL